jgi:hypothetical protein
MKKSYYVKAVWDPEASVWISDTDIPGLVIEADTLAEFEQAMLQYAPEMLVANEGDRRESIFLDFSANARRELALA